MLGGLILQGDRYVRFRSERELGFKVRVGLRFGLGLRFRV